MKNLKKVFSFLLAMVLTLAMTATVFAANITIKDSEEGAEFAAYKLLNATDGGEGKFAYTVNATYSSILQEVTGKTTDAEIVDYISALDADGVRTLADTIYGKVKDMTADATTTTDSFTNVDQGYYLIVETKAGTNADGSDGSISLVMLDTAGLDTIEVSTKEDTPELEKKLIETNDSNGNVTNWQDGADYDLNDEIEFQLTGTVSAKIANYKTYYYEFHDTLSKGLDFVSGSVAVKIDGTDVTEAFTIADTANTDDTTALSVKCADIKAITGVTVTSTSKVVVTYKAKLNEDAVIGSAGNANEAYLEYSNNPYDEGDGEPDTGTTPKDKVIVFTYQLTVNKVDSEGAALEGAGFTLYKYDNDATDWVEVGNEITGVTTFDFSRVDAGQYKLVETTVPAGYNKAADLEFNVVATYDETADDPALKTLVITDKEGNMLSDPDDNNATFTATLDTGVVATDVVNNSGSELPSTGGIGTTIFYVLGGILVVAAGVLLIARKRASR